MYNVLVTFLLAMFSILFMENVNSPIAVLPLLRISLSKQVCVADEVRFVPGSSFDFYSSNLL